MYYKTGWVRAVVVVLCSGHVFEYKGTCNTKRVWVTVVVVIFPVLFFALTNIFNFLLVQYKIYMVLFVSPPYLTLMFPAHALTLQSFSAALPAFLLCRMIKISFRRSQMSNRKKRNRAGDIKLTEYLCRENHRKDCSQTSVLYGFTSSRLAGLQCLWQYKWVTLWLMKCHTSTTMNCPIRSQNAFAFAVTF